MTLSTKSDFENAPTEYRHALSLNPDLIEAHYGIGALLANRGEINAAIDEFRFTLTRRPDYFRAQFGLANAIARIAAESGDQAELVAARDAYISALALKPRDIGTLNGLAPCTFSAGQLW